MVRKKLRLVAFALVASLLVATMPAAASHELAVAAQHTTDTDFNNADTLEKLNVQGSGSAANVTLRKGIIDDFEDGDITTANPDWDGWTGSTGDLTTVSTTDLEGNSAGEYTVDGGNFQDIQTTADSAVQPNSITFFVRMTDGSGSDSDAFEVHLDDSSGNRWMDLRFTGDGSGIEEHTNGVDNFSTSTYAIDTTINATIQDINYTANTYDIVINGTTELNDHDPGVDFADLKDFDIRSDANNGDQQVTRFDHIQLDDGTDITPATYISQNHTVDSSEQGFVNITDITNATATVTWETNGGSGWSTLNETSGITTAANHTFTWSVESNDTARVNVTVFNESGNGEPSFTMDDEGVQFSANATAVDNSSASPTGGLNTASPTLEIDINDSDFGLAQDDSVDVEFFVDGSSQGTDTLTSNGTASLGIGPLDGGDHTWHVVANDSYEHSVTSQTFDISTPSNITFRREQPNHPVIDDREINVTIYGEADGDQFVQNFTTSDGSISLTGVPVDERLVVVAAANGFHQREVILTEIFNQTDVYLLNTSESSVEVTFNIQDSTGEFSQSDTEFIIERSINRSLFDSGGFTAEAIAGDRLGAVTEYSGDLKQDQRYTIIIRNPGGDTRTLGAQVAKADGTIPIRITSIDLSANETQGYNWSANVIQSGANEFVEFTYVDNDDLTSSVDLVIHEKGNTSNEIHNQTHSGTFGELRVTEQLTGADINRTWVVSFDASRGSETKSGQVIVGQDTSPLGVQLDDEWEHRIALLSLVLVAFIVGGGVSPEAGGIAIVSAAGMWLYVGWMPAEVTAVAIGFGSITAVGFAIGKRGGEPVQ